MSAHHPPVTIARVTEPELAQLRPQRTELLRSPGFAPWPNARHRAAGDAANHVYRKTGWTELGRMAGYVKEPTGEHATVIYYRALEAAGPVHTAGSGA